MPNAADRGMRRIKRSIRGNVGSGDGGARQPTRDGQPLHLNHQLPLRRRYAFLARTASCIHVSGMRKSGVSK